MTNNDKGFNEGIEAAAALLLGTANDIESGFERQRHEIARLTGAVAAGNAFRGTLTSHKAAYDAEFRQVGLLRGQAGHVLTLRRNKL
jgi:hypothetical protein